MFLRSVLKDYLQFVCIESVLIITIVSLSVCDVETNRTGKFWKSITNAHGWNAGLVSHSGLPEVYFDYGVNDPYRVNVPFDVNVPTRTYLPPLEWPDYSFGNHYPPQLYPTTTIQPPRDPPVYLPPPITTTTTEFTLPEVIDAKKQIFIPNVNNVMRESKQSFDKPNLNHWSGSNVYRDSHNEPVKIDEMKCDSGVEGHFRATLLWASRNPNVSPVFEDLQRAHLGIDDCVLSVERAENEGGARIHLDLRSSAFPACGVNKCSDSNQKEYLCTRLRFPTMEGLKLIEDTVLTLRCRVQEPLVFHTKRIDLPVNDAVAGRSSGAVATGGASNEMRCHLDVLRRGSSSALFSTSLEPGARVLLGEELLVRLTVAEGDGWQFSRLSEVVVSGGGGGGGGRGDTRVTLLTSDGCLAAGATAICPRQPRRETPFTHSLVIRAPMFQSSSSGSSIQLTVRVVACRRAQACATHCTRVARSLSGNGQIYHPKSYHEEVNELQNQYRNTTRSYSNHNDTDNKRLNEFNYTSKVVNGYDIKNFTHHNNSLEDDVQLIVPNDVKGAIYTAVQDGNANNINEKQKQYVKVPLKREPARSGRKKRLAKLTTDSVATVTLTIIRPSYSEINQTVIKSKNMNDKPIAMIIALGGVVSVLMLAVGLTYFYCKQRQTKEVLW